jgi:hypothetical protein
MGRHPKPLEQKRRLGAPGKRRLPPPLPPVDPVDPAEVALDPEVVLARVLEDGVGWLAKTDVVVLALLRQSLAERVLLQAAVTAGTGRRSELRALDKEILSMLASLGFGPTARASLGVAEVRPGR